MKFGAFVVGCVLALTLGCGEDRNSSLSREPLDLTGNTTSMGEMEQTPSMDEGAESTPNVPSGCDVSDFDVSEQVAGPEPFGLSYQAIAPNRDGNGSDIMLTQIYGSFGGPTGPGRYELDGVNFRDCGLCLLIQKGCVEGEGCEKVFYASEGTVEITALDDSRFAARYENVVYREVTISDGDSTSTEVPDGEVWCIDGFGFDEMIQSGTPGGPQDECAGGAACVGDTIRDFSVTSCATGEPTSVRTYFEGSSAALFLAVAGWCSACSMRVPELASVEEQTPGFRVMYVLGEDRQYNAPTTRYCATYAQTHNVPLDRVFIDHNGMYSHAQLFGNVWPYPVNNSIGLPFHAVMDPQDFSYDYGDGAPGGSGLSNAVEALLNR